MNNKGTALKELYEIKGIVLDVDGTLLRGEEALPGLRSFFNFLNKNQISYVVATNNSTKTPLSYQKKLKTHGVEIDYENVINCSLVASEYLQRELGKGASLYIIGEGGLHEVMREAGFQIAKGLRSNVDAVLVGGDSGLTYEKLKNAILLIQRGAKFVGTNPDLLYPTEEGLVPEAGTILAAIEAATGMQPVVMGKPEKYLYEMAISRMKCLPKETAMLGDRLETDVLGAQKENMKTILVETGVDNGASIKEKGIFPDFIVKDLVELVALWKSSLSKLN